ncbi:MAG: hypothetical protein ACPGPC_02230 [Alphaproteobacteria bacterium]
MEKIIAAPTTNSNGIIVDRLKIAYKMARKAPTNAIPNRMPDRPKLAYISITHGMLIEVVVFSGAIIS